MRAEVEKDVEVQAEGALMKGILVLPPRSEGVILFAHGSGSGRFSPRNQFVAKKLQQAGLATLLIDLLEEEEAEDRRKVFDINLLADRLLAATEWLSNNPDTSDLRIGYFGASTGAAAALQAAVRWKGEPIGAVVSRGGRPDLALRYLPQVKLPTILIVGADDEPVVSMNREAFALLRCEKELVIVPGATHLFEEPGKLEEVAQLAGEWFQRYLSTGEE